MNDDDFQRHDDEKTDPFNGLRGLISGIGMSVLVLAFVGFCYAAIRDEREAREAYEAAVKSESERISAEIDTCRKSEGVPFERISQSMQDERLVICVGGGKSAVVMKRGLQ